MKQREHQTLLNQAVQNRNSVTKELFDFEGEGQKIFTERAGKRSRMKELLNQQKSSIESYRASTRNLELSKKNLRRMATTLERTEVQIKVLKDEKGTEIRSKLSSQEQEELETVKAEREEAKETLDDAKAKYAKLEKALDDA